MFSMTCSSVEPRESYLSRRQLFFAYGKLSTITGLKCDCSFFHSSSSSQISSLISLMVHHVIHPICECSNSSKACCKASPIHGVHRSPLAVCLVPIANNFHMFF